MRPQSLLFYVIAVALTACNSNDTATPSQSPSSQSNAAPAALAPAAAADWCAGHGVPESKCTKCNPELIPAFQAAGDWCEEHGYPESVCPICNPEEPPGASAAAAPDWCLEHGLAESKCTKCNPELIPAFQAAGDWCDEHGYPESVCPICNPQQAPEGAEEAALEARTVRLRTPKLAETAGIETAAARLTQRAASVECTAEIAFHGDRVADIRALVPGIVRRVHVTLGQKVKRGAPLFELESTQVGEIQGALQAARERARAAQAELERQRELLASDIASARDVEIAEVELTTARSQARSAESALRVSGAAQASPSGRYTLRAPFAGTIVRRPAMIGLFATESTSLATLGDTSVMWALCEVPEADAARVAIGQPMRVTLDGSGKEAAKGEISWMAAEVDPRTRTVTARAEIPNSDASLRANQFARAQIATSGPRTAVSVPRAAVQRVGDRELVFVRTGPGIYEPRVVRLYGTGDVVQVEGRVSDGDAVVTTGAVLLRTELLPGSIGAGCCEVAPPGDD